ncbi:MAG: ATP-binding cassette domain-containing protein, partial [Planctomycetota bacterium]|nr:ATP-binding cassette domain-containing protein [Planctomycetota bacterium]
TLNEARTLGAQRGARVVRARTLSRARTRGAWRATHVGYVFQAHHLIPVLTAYENIELPLHLFTLDARQRHERVALALAAVGLTDRATHYPRQLSGGQEQRVAIARALVADPPLLICDEPTGNLDRDSAQATMHLLRRLNEERGKTLVMVTHDVNAASFGSRVLRLDKGKLLEQPAESVQ